MSRSRVSTDIGGTFTDVAYDEETGTYGAGKSSTTPQAREVYGMEIER